MAGQGSHYLDNDEQNGMAVVVVPFPAQSHLTQLLHLSHLLATSYGIPVHFTGSTTYICQAKIRDPNSTNPLIHFHDFQLPPNPNASSSSSTFLQTILPTVTNLRQPVFKLLQELSTKVTRLVVIHDSLMSSVVQEVKSIPNAEAYTFYVVSAFSRFFTLWEYYTTRDRRPFRLDHEDDDHYNVIPSIEKSNSHEYAEFMAKQFKLNSTFESGRLYNTSRVIEGKYVQLLEKLAPKAKYFAIGPLVPVEKVTVKSTRHRCLEWLDRQDNDSVIYVSFGTSTSMSDEQIRELAIGLERSGQKFIWVLRSADHDDEQPGSGIGQLLEGYSNKDQGMVVRDWAPQLEILAHRATGGFMSHCGWGSCLESISVGVPIVAWPMHSDQPKNSVLVTRVLKIGLLVSNGTTRADNVLVTSSRIADVVRRVMSSTQEGVEMRRRARALRSQVRGRGSLDQGVVARYEMDSFVAYITRTDIEGRQGETGTVALPMIQKSIHKMSRI